MMMMDEFYCEGFSSRRRKRCKTNGRRRDGKMTMTMTKKTVKKSGFAVFCLRVLIFYNATAAALWKKREERRQRRAREVITTAGWRLS
jgi:hypothetical protein